MSTKHKTCFLFIFSLLVSLLISSHYHQTSYSAETSVDPDIYKTLEEKSYVPALILLDNNEDIEKKVLSSLEKNNASNASAVVQELRTKAEYSTKEILPYLEVEIENGNIVDYQPFWIVNAFSARINKEALEVLSALPIISSIMPDRKHSRIELSGIPSIESKEALASTSEHMPYIERRPWNLTLINAPQAWQKNFFGDEIVVAIMDTGVDLEHSLLIDSYRGYTPGHNHESSWYDATGDLTEEKEGPIDLHGHGTHMAGIIMGGSPENPFGVAPSAKWMAVNIFSDGYTWDSHIIQAYQWLLAPGGNPEHAPHIVNCSWASRPEYKSDYLQWEILYNLEKAGVFVVFAAGNNAQAGPGSPASYPHAFSVGALNENFQISDFSSRGPVNWQEMTFSKPELVAPGTNIKSTWVGGGFSALDGTSTAAAHVAGAAALLLESRPEASPSELRNILQETSRWHIPWEEEGKRPNNTYGYGFLDVHAAVTKEPSPEKEKLFHDKPGKGLHNWKTSPQNPWKETDEIVNSGGLAFADSPGGYYANNAQSWLSLLEPIHVCQHWTPVLSFHHFYDLEEGGVNQDDYGYIEISQNAEDWLPIFRFSGSNKGFQRFSLPLNLPQETDDIYIRFRLQSNNNGPGKGWYINNIEVSALPRNLEGLRKLHLIPESTVIEKGENSSLEAEAYFCSAHFLQLDLDFIEWSSSDNSVATVENGKIKGHSAGEAVIKGVFAGQTNKVQIKVVEIEKPWADPQPGVFVNSVEVVINTGIAEADIYYTLDGNEPNQESNLYEEPLFVEESTTIKAKSFLNDRAGPEAEFNYEIVQGTTVEGLINLQGRRLVDDKTKLFFICQEKGTSYNNISLHENGRFSNDLPSGNYLLVIERQQYLTKVIEVGLQDVDTKKQLGSLEINVGDISGNNKIELLDLILLSLSYNAVERDAEWNSQADLNGDGIIDNHDLALLKSNYGKTGASYRD